MLYKNQVLEHIATKQRWRILELGEDGTVVWLFNISAKKARPRALPIDFVEDQQAFSEVERPPIPGKLTPSTSAKQRREKAMKFIAPLVASTDIFLPAKRSALVQARAMELKCSPQTLYSYLRAWWSNGQSLQALTPLFHHCGNVAGATGGRGRPSKFGLPTYQMTEADHSIIQRAVQTFLNNALLSLKDTYQTMLEERYSYLDGDGRLLLKLPGERPSFVQFKHHARKHLPAELVIRSRKGNAEFELEHRPKLGSLRLSTFTVGDVYEIDSTVVDVVLVHEHDRSKIVGKPALYIIIDRKTGLVVGFYVGYEESSWVAAMQAILSISEDKGALCRRYGVHYDPADWPAHCVMPKEFVGDRGSEMLGTESNKIAEGLELTMTNLPARRGDWKPHVECGFKQTHRAMRGFVPGYVPPEDFGKRQKRDYSQEAALTLTQFRKVILEAIIKRNKSPIRDYPLSPKYVLAEMLPTPINLWNAEIRDRAGLLAACTEAEVRLALLPQADVTVTREGIRLGDCLYSAKEAIDKGWFVAAGSGRFSVRASYDLRLVDTILVRDENHPNGYFEARLLEKCSHFLGLSHWEVAALGHLSRKIRQVGEQTRQQMVADFHQHIAPTVKAAKAETKKATKGLSRASRKKDIRAARQDALQLERMASAATPPSTGPAERAPVLPLPVPQPHSGPETPSPDPSVKSRQQRYQELMNGRH